MSHSSLNCWIQRSDYSADEHGKVDLEQAIRLYEEFDWDGEIARFSEDDDELSCACGMGLLNDDRSLLLHVCPLDHQAAFFNLDYPVKRRIKLLPWGGSRSVYVAESSRTLVPHLFELLYAEDYVTLVSCATADDKRV